MTFRVFGGREGSSTTNLFDVPTSQEQLTWCKLQQQLFEESLSSDPPRNIYSIPVDMFVSPDSREEHILEAYYLQQRN
jgi:hypothetical protein